MNKKGFTLIELLAVIALLAVITIMASAGIMTFSKKSKENLYCAKIKLIESNAAQYGIRYEAELNQSTTFYEGNKSLTIKVNDLVQAGKLEADKHDDVISPIDETRMNDMEIILYLKNNQIYAVMPNNIC